MPHGIEVTPIISLLWDADTRASIFLAYPSGQNLKLGCFRVGEIRSWWRPFGPDPSPTSRYDCTLILNLEEGSRDSDLLARALIYGTFRSGPFCIRPIFISKLSRELKWFTFWIFLQNSTWKWIGFPYFHFLNGLQFGFLCILHSFDLVWVPFFLSWFFEGKDGTLFRSRL